MNWGAIKAAVASYMHRGDVDAQMATFLPLAEERIYRGEVNTPAVRLRDMLKTATLSDGTLPADFLEAKWVYQSSDPKRPLEYRPVDQLSTEFQSFSIEGASISLSPRLGFPVDMFYYAKPATPVDDADENLIMQMAPSVYICSLLVEAARWARDDALGQREAANYSSAVTSLLSSDKVASHSGARLQMKMRGQRSWR